MPYIGTLIFWRSKFCSVSLYDQPFSRYKAVENWENQKCTELPQNDLEHNNARNQNNSNFTNLLPTSIETPGMSIHAIGGVNVVRVLSWCVSFETFTQVWCHGKKKRNFTILFTTLVETLIGVCINFWERISCVISKDMSSENFPPIRSNINGNENKIKKNLNKKKEENNNKPVWGI